jgi:short-subunit dehydrogenase
VTAYEAGHGTSLKGRLALVTGASSGIGHAVALALARQGMELLLVGRRKDALRSVAEQAGGANIVVADLASAPGRQLVVDAVPPMLHVLVHSAGIYFRGAVLGTTGETWAALDALNLHAPLLLTAACLHALKVAQGHIVFVNSTAGMEAAANVAAYAASKHGLRAAADALRQEVNPDGIRVLSVFPGRTDTPMQKSILTQEGRMASPGSLLRPEDVAVMIVSALMLSPSAEVTELTLRPARPI